MPLTFPVFRADFFGRLTVVAATMRLSSGVAHNVPRSGEVTRVAYAERLWEGRVELKPGPQADLDQIYAIIERLEDADATFVLSPAWRTGPISDATATDLGASTPGITATANAGRTMSMDGLPANYTLTAGDFLSLQYAGRIHLHRVVEGKPADVSGVLSNIEVNPPVRAGWTVGDSVRLKNPICKAVMVPGSVQPISYRGRHGAGVGFDWRQTLR